MTRVYKGLAAVIIVVGLAGPKEARSEWDYSETTDRMTGTVTRVARTKAQEELKFSFPYDGAVTAELRLQEHSNGKREVVLYVDKGQFLCNPYDDCTIHVKFDSHEPMLFGGNTAADGSTNYIFIENATGFMSILKESQSVLVSATFYQEGERVMEFDVRGLDWNRSPK